MAKKKKNTSTPTTISAATAPYYDINKGIMVNADGTAFIAPQAAPTPTEPEDVGLVFGAGAPGTITEPTKKPEAEPTSPAPSSTPSSLATPAEAPAYYDINKGIMVSPTGEEPVVPGPATPTNYVYDITKGAMVPDDKVAPPKLTTAQDVEKYFQGLTDDILALEEIKATEEELRLQIEEEGRQAEEDANAAVAEAEKLTQEATQAEEALDKFKYVSTGLGGDLSKVGNAALAAAVAQLTNIGIDAEEMLGAMYDIRKAYPDINSADALSLLKYDKRYNAAYQKRFSGNAERAKAGLAPLDDKEYLANEAAYRKIFNAYGIDRFANPETYATFIAKDLAPEEIGTRVSLVYNNIQRIPVENKAALRAAGLTDSDLMAYALSPATTLPELQKKVQMAEIGSQALRQGLSISAKPMTEASPYSNVPRTTIGIEAIQRENLSPEAIATATRNVARVLPEAEKLTSIYAGRGPEYGRKQAEEEFYLGLASAEKAREQLGALEKASFSGESGVLKSRRRSMAGLL